MTDEAPLDDLEERSPFAWLRERDVDLLVCAELHANGALTRLLARLVSPLESRFGGAWVSLSELDGESDLIARFESTRGSAVALIENKIAAPFQRNQGKRYTDRADRWSRTPGVACVRTVLLAPGDYMTRPGAESFDVHLTYEDAARALRSENDRRSIFLANALAAGVEAFRRGYVATPNAAVTNMWSACWKTSLRVAPALNFQEPGLKPGGSTWFYFRKAEGFSEQDAKHAVVVYKAESGHADLQFSGTSISALALLVGKLLDPTMKVVAANKSASIRIAVPPIIFKGSAVDQEAAIIEGLGACERLRAFFVEHRDQFLKWER